MFQPFKQWAEQDTESYIIGNNATINLYDAVSFMTTAGVGGYVWPSNVSTSSAIYGVVVGFTASPGGASQQNLQSTQVIATANNQTSNQYRARVLPARQARLFIADLNQTAGTTTGSGDPGFFWLSTTNQGQLTESSYVVTSGTAEQFFSVGAGATSNTTTTGAGNSDNGSIGLFPATSTQVVGFFSNNKTV